MSSHDRGRVTAVLGPTNTGKTHYAIERMLGHRTGVIGLPLRLLAREVYERCVAARGPSVVALVTGEERIVPPRAAYWVCTVEAMPLGLGADFLAVDEIQLCADPERGHVFTDRLLNARGLHETLFLGAETMRGAIAALVPGVRFVRRERFSTLSYVGEKKISRMQPRSAIVGFSVESVYAIAELIRRQKGRGGRGHGRALAAHPQRPGGDVSERGRGLPGGDRRHRHGAQPRRQARGVLLDGQVRRAADAGAGAQRARPDRGTRGAGTPRPAPSASPARRSRSSPRWWRPSPNRASCPSGGSCGATPTCASARWTR